MTDQPEKPDQPDKPEAQRPRVSVDAEVWQHIDRLLGDLPYRTVAPIAQALGQTGGAQPIKD